MNNSNTTEPTLLQSAITNHLQSATQNKIIHSINSGFKLAMVFVIYFIGIITLLFPLIANRVFPFQVLSKISNTDAVITAIGSKPDVQAFVFGIYTMFVIIGMLILFIAMQMHQSIRTKNLLFSANNLLLKTNELITKNNSKNELPIGATMQAVQPKELPNLNSIN